MKRCEISEIPESALYKSLIKVINPKMVSASPLRVERLQHDLHTNSKSNQKTADVFSKEKHTTLHHFDVGALNLYADAIMLLTTDKDFPIQFYCMWKHIICNQKPAIHTQYIWCDKAYRHLRINGVPLSAYCLFDVLLPKYKIVVLADEHTKDGGKSAKNHIQNAKKRGVYVYIKDEHSNIYEITKPEVVIQDADFFWGIDPANKKRLFILSTEDIFA